MCNKEPIPAGQRWGTLTFVKEFEHHNKRKVVVKCDCGIEKVLKLSALASVGTGSCGTSRCLQVRKDKLEAQIAILEQRVIKESYSTKLGQVARMERDLINGTIPISYKTIQDMHNLTREAIGR